MEEFYLAQINIAKAKYSMESEIMKGFAYRLEEINTLADSSPGFVWRLHGETGDATSIQAFEVPMLILNMSVWSDLESLKNFVYKSMHVELIQDRDAWFSKIERMHQALWWVSKGNTPEVNERWRFEKYFN